MSLEFQYHYTALYISLIIDTISIIYGIFLSIPTYNSLEIYVNWRSIIIILSLNQNQEFIGVKSNIPRRNARISSFKKPEVHIFARECLVIDLAENDIFPRISVRAPPRWVFSEKPPQSQPKPPNDEIYEINRIPLREIIILPQQYLTFHHNMNWTPDPICPRTNLIWIGAIRGVYWQIEGRGVLQLAPDCYWPSLPFSPPPVPPSSSPLHLFPLHNDSLCLLKPASDGAHCPLILAGIE